MRFPRLAALVTTTLTVATLGALGAGPARADGDTPPTVHDVDYNRYVNSSVTVTFSVTNGTYAPDGAEVGVADKSNREVDATATVTSHSDTGYTASATLSTADFPAGDTLYVGIDAGDANGGDGVYEHDGVPVVIDRTPPAISLQSVTLVAGLGLQITTSDDTPTLVKTTCSFDGAPAIPCGGFIVPPGTALGLRSVTVTASDLAGNQSSATGSIRRWQNTVETATLGSSSRFGVGQPLSLRVLSQAVNATGITPTGTLSITDNGMQIGSTALQAAGVGLAGADVKLKAGALGNHIIAIAYGGDSLSRPSTFTLGYTAIPVLRAVIKPGAVSGGKLHFTFTCPPASARCVGFLQLGNSKAGYSASPGRRGSLALALPAATLAALHAHRPILLKILFADNVRHSAIVVHLH